MNNIQNLILDSHDLTNVKLEKLLSAACPKNIDFADIYFQYINSESWVLEDGIVKSGSSNIDSGVGIRSVSGDKSGFAYSNDFNFDNLITAANMSKCIVEHGQSRTIKIGEEKKIKRLYESVSPLDYGKDETKVLFLKNIDKYIRDKDSRVDQVIVNLVGVYDSVFVLNTDGVNVFDDRPLVRFSVMVILKVGCFV